VKALPLCIAALLFAACDDTPPPKSPDAVAAEERRDRLERKLAAATDAVDSGKTDLARQLADQARAWARDSDMMKILDITMKADQTDARRVADKVKAAAKPPCDEAFGIVIRALAQTQRKPFQRALKDRAEDALIECSNAEITVAIAKGDFAAARAVLERPELAPTVTAKRRQGLATSVRDGIVEHVSGQIEGEIKEGKYEQAVAKVADAISQGILEADDEQEVLGKVHDAAAPKQVAALTAAIGSKKAPSAPVVELERTAKALKWTILPSEIVRARLALGTWIECQRLKCTLPKPEPKYVYGKLDVRPAEASSATVRSAIPTGTKLWVVGRARKLALIATEEPGANMSIEKRMFSAAGWVPDSQLRAEDTSDWLPPGEELKGMRVFGPLRESEPKVLYIGFVTAVAGKNVDVKRMSDDKVVTVPRTSLHTAKLPKGQKVLAGCPGMIGISEARIDHDLPLGPRGAPMMGLVCINAAGGDGPVHDEFIGALGAKAEWLPPNKP
jgi:hypothetical protein